MLSAKCRHIVFVGLNMLHINGKDADSFIDPVEQDFLW